jgi:hypothetical protein
MTTKNPEVNLGDLKARAELAQQRYEAGEKGLYRDGKQLYSDDVHREEVSRLRSERNAVLGEVEEEARAEGLAADAAAERARNADPAEFLSPEELERANARRAFALDAARTMRPGAFAERCEAVLAGGGRGAIFAHAMAARRRREEILAGRRETLDSQPGSRPAGGVPDGTELDGAILKMREHIDGGRTARAVEEAQGRRRASSGVQELAYVLKRDAKTFGELHSRGRYSVPGR